MLMLRKLLIRFVLPVPIDDPALLMMLQSDQHIEAKKVNDPLVKGWWKSGSLLRQVFGSNRGN